VIVCQCGVVSDSAVVEASRAGDRTLAEVCRSTGAGQNCGVCVFSIRRLLCEHGPTAESVDRSEIRVAAS
jgi:bacterioferritin-associated ferredoxin